MDDPLGAATNHARLNAANIPAFGTKIHGFQRRLSYRAAPYLSLCESLATMNYHGAPGLELGEGNVKLDPSVLKGES